MNRETLIRFAHLGKQIACSFASLRFIRTCVRLSTASLIQNIHECLTKRTQIQESEETLKQVYRLFLLKACSERIIDFYFLELTTFSHKKFCKHFG